MPPGVWTSNSDSRLEDDNGVPPPAPTAPKLPAPLLFAVGVPTATAPLSFAFTLDADDLALPAPPAAVVVSSPSRTWWPAGVERTVLGLIGLAGVRMESSSSMSSSSLAGAMVAGVLPLVLVMGTRERMPFFFFVVVVVVVVLADFLVNEGDWC